jgi:hypothetical protein
MGKARIERQAGLALGILGPSQAEVVQSFRRQSRLLQELRPERQLFLWGLRCAEPKQQSDVAVELRDTGQAVEWPQQKTEYRLQSVT